MARTIMQLVPRKYADIRINTKAGIARHAKRAGDRDRSATRRSWTIIIANRVSRMQRRPTGSRAGQMRAVRR